MEQSNPSRGDRAGDSGGAGRLSKDGKNDDGRRWVVNAERHDGDGGGAMNTLRKGFWIGLLLCAVGFPVHALTNPSSAIVKIYEMRLSPNADCSSSVTIFSDPSGTPRDMVQNPTLGSGAVPNGTYKCFIAHISDQITFTPAANDG